MLMVDDRLVRIALQRWFTRICEDPVLQKDDELRLFIESDFGVGVTIFIAALPSSIVRLLYKIPRPSELDQVLTTVQSRPSAFCPQTNFRLDLRHKRLDCRAFQSRQARTFG